MYISETCSQQTPVHFLGGARQSLDHVFRRSSELYPGLLSRLYRSRHLASRLLVLVSTPVKPAPQAEEAYSVPLLIQRSLAKVFRSPSTQYRVASVLERTDKLIPYKLGLILCFN